ncbi:hypothetical protein [Actibacterium sp. 188UL27-1]|uniref:hypothetical protein n=1 Tax=Actibacterium sp. 188UL27-1 TaxID=2786961 RepID=UPI00195BD501|nr:hypothetical protein [Actibacterium sp. 188UL27-1]MBM7069176.1 hypothetical protein [Actibacterium sp. 188UL27-1]
MHTYTTRKAADPWEAKIIKHMPILGLALGAVVASSALADTTTRIGHATPENCPLYQAFGYFEEQLETRSDGCINNMRFMELGGRRCINDRAPIDSRKAGHSIDAVPLPQTWGEIYSSLRQSLIDRQKA